MTTTNRLIAVLLAAVLCAPGIALAERQGQAEAELAKPLPIRTEILIPTSGLASLTKVDAEGNVADLAQYIGAVYNFLISIVGLVAAVMMIVGGFQYLTSAGDSGRIGAAKTRMANALIGLLLAFGAYTLLYTINPALLTLKVPGGIKGVRSELSFIEFCDDLAKRLGIGEDEITLVGGDKDCGKAGFYLTKIKSSDGTLVDNRFWCTWRGDKEQAARLRAQGEKYVNDYGCEDNTSISGERVIGKDLEVHTLSVCLPVANAPSFAELNEQYDKTRRIGERLARCQSCNTFSDGSMQAVGYPVGDLGCQMWQNVAHNGDPRDNDFKFSRKKIIWDTRVAGKDDRSRRMYYCGYSPSNQQCVYVPILCHNVGECDDYDDMVMNYCEATARDATITCHASEELGSSWGTQTGNAQHLIPVCEADPCEKGGQSGCEVGGLAGTRNSIVGRVTGGYARMGVRVLSGGILGSISCDAK